MPFRRFRDLEYNPLAERLVIKSSKDAFIFPRKANFLCGLINQVVQRVSWKRGIVGSNPGCGTLTPAFLTDPTTVLTRY